MEWGLPGLGGGENGESVFNGYKFQFYKMKTESPFWSWTVVMVV